MSKPQHRVRLTAGRVDAFTCPAGKSQAFLWDTEAPALALRVTPTGRKTSAWFTLAAIALFLALTTNHAWAAVLLTAWVALGALGAEPASGWRGKEAVQYSFDSYGPELGLPGTVVTTAIQRGKRSRVTW